jgi:hypothetical protein
MAMNIPAAADGIRRSRMLIIRSSYRAMEMSALATHRTLFAKMKGWNGTEIGTSREPWRSTFRIPMPDKTIVESEWIWLAVDDNSFDKLRSVEATSIYINECAHDFNDATIITKCIESLGRYPPKSSFSQEVIEKSNTSGKPIYRACLIGDYNPPNSMHELCKLADNPPPGWSFFTQPSPLLEIPVDHYDGDKSIGVEKDGFIYVPNFEGCQYARVHNENFGYWLNMLGGADRATIDSSILGKPSKNLGGKPVFPNFSEDSVRRSILDSSTYGRWPITIGIDTSGVNPAAVIGSLQNGTLYLLDELFHPDTSFEEFVEELLLPMLQSKYATNRIQCVIDPSNPRAGTDKRTALGMLVKAGLKASLASTNHIQNRLDAVTHFVNKRGGLSVGGHMQGTLHMLRGGYKYEAVRGQSGVFKPTPAKDNNSHLADGLQYLCLHVRGAAAVNANNFKLQLRPSQIRAI